ncbi:MAG: ATP-binding protein, partial [Lentisphaeria bacterium]|nr:ATP-binding protein [Lentisphaeria bacterium]
DYRKLISGGNYYVDKTLLIQRLLDRRSEVTLYARPRRFGKSLNLSMLDYFFNVDGSGKGLFDDCALSRSERPYREEMGKYPVISMSFKDLKMDTYEEAADNFRAVCAEVFVKHQYLLNDRGLLPEDRDTFLAAMGRRLPENQLPMALKLLMARLHGFHGQPVVLLLDEYDVPLQTGYLKGYYDRVLNLIRALMSATCKTNPHLRLAVHTGCLRISGESIYTGFNNPSINTVLSSTCGDCFGFTPDEVKALLEYYGMGGLFGTVREWYDGYRFGDAEIYNPWSVISFVVENRDRSAVRPEPYWANTSGNDLLQTLIEDSVSGNGSRGELETLLSGGTVRHSVREQINYAGMKMDSTALWTTLLYTGYLRTKDFPNQLPSLDDLELQLPNREVAETLKHHLDIWYKQAIPTWNRTGLVKALAEGDAGEVRFQLNRHLAQTISYHDRAENFYHGFIAGLLASIEGWRCESNRESGNGRPDLVFFTRDSMDCAVVIEIKPASSRDDLAGKARQALDQASERNYVADFRRLYRTVRAYGIACYNKECTVLAGE